MRLSETIPSFLLDYIPNFDLFLDRGGSTYIKQVTPNQVKEFFDFLHERHHGVKLRVSYLSNNSLVIKQPTEPHEGPSYIVMDAMRRFNAAVNNGITLEPLESLGQSRIYFQGTGRFFEPDTSERVVDRLHSSPNLVVETHFRNGQMNYDEFLEHLRAYILDTEDIMVVVGFIIFEPIAPADVSMVSIIFTRDNLLNHGRPDRLVSFGTHILGQNLREMIEAQAGVFMTGVGINPAPDNTLTVVNANAATYVLQVEGHYLLRQDNDGNQFAIPPAQQMMQLRLFDVRQRVLRAFARMI